MCCTIWEGNCIRLIIMKEISKRNAKKLGLDVMLLQTQEECAELTKAISKYNRTRGIGQITEMSQGDAYQNMLEEIADVNICVEQLIYLLGVKEEINDLKDKAFEKVQERYKNF